MMWNDVVVVTVIVTVTTGRGGPTHPRGSAEQPLHPLATGTAKKGWSGKYSELKIEIV